jgi:hypothetical protein
MLRAAGAEAVTAQNRTPLLWFEWDVIRLAALVANNLKAFAIVAAAASRFRTAKVGPAGVAARFTSLRVTQAPFAIIILFTFSKWEGLSTLGASDVHIRH